MANIEAKYFKDIDLNDRFFDSLKVDYEEFIDWFKKNLVRINELLPYTKRVNF